MNQSLQQRLQVIFNLNPFSGSKSSVRVYRYRSLSDFTDPVKRCNKKLRTDLGKFTNAAKLRTLDVPSDGVVVFVTSAGAYPLDKKNAVLYLEGMPFDALNM